MLCSSNYMWIPCWKVKVCSYSCLHHSLLCWHEQVTAPALPLLQGSWLTPGLKIFLRVPGVADKDNQGSGGKEATHNLWCACSPHSHAFFLLLLLSTHPAEPHTGKEQKTKQQMAHNPYSLIPFFMPDCRNLYTGYWAWTPRYVNPLWENGHNHAFGQPKFRAEQNMQVPLNERALTLEHVQVFFISAPLAKAGAINALSVFVSTPVLVYTE